MINENENKTNNRGCSDFHNFLCRVFNAMLLITKFSILYKFVLIQMKTKTRALQVKLVFKDLV